MTSGATRLALPLSKTCEGHDGTSTSLIQEEAELCVSASPEMNRLIASPASSCQQAVLPRTPRQGLQASRTQDVSLNPNLTCSTKDSP